MKSFRRVNGFGVRVTVLACTFLAAAGSASAEEAFGKFRISFTVNNQSTSDGLRTNSGNTSRFHGPLGGVTAIDDPRPDAGNKNEASIKDGFRYDLQVSYGYAKWKWGELTLDTGIGYFKSDVGDLEVAGQFDQVDPVRILCGDVTRYHLIFIPIGQVTQVPVKLGTTLRFRPRATGGPLRAMSPYIGVGVGYIYAKIDASGEFLKFSDNVAHSVGHYTRAIGRGLAGPAGPDHQLKAAEATAPDSFEYHLNAGLEFPLRKGLQIVFSTSWMWADKPMDITIDGRHSFGQATPIGDTEFQYPVGGMPVVVNSGGLVDYASGTPIPRENASCKFRVGPKDGVPDVGSYFAQGGEIRYDGFSVGLGLRYQF